MSGLSARALRRLVCAGAVGAAAVLLAACGGPSASQAATHTLELGIAAQRAGHYGTATTDYDKVLSSEPKNIYALYDLGDVEQFQKQTAAAQTHYLQVLAVDPNFEGALYNLGILVSSSNPTEAKALFGQVIKLSPHDSPAHLDLGKVLLALGQKRAGDQQINFAIALDPKLKRFAPPGS